MLFRSDAVVVLPDFVQVVVVAEDAEALGLVGVPVRFEQPAHERVVQAAENRQVQVAVFGVRDAHRIAFELVPRLLDECAQMRVVVRREFDDGLVEERELHVVAQLRKAVEQAVVERQRVEQAEAHGRGERVFREANAGARPHVDDAERAGFVDGLTVRHSDWVVEKFRPDSFIGTHLDHILRTQGIQSLILLGTTTEGCVESTVRSASYHDYYTVVVSDAVASPNAELHEGSLRFFRARYPTHTAAEVLSAIRQSKAPA